MQAIRGLAVGLLAMGLSLASAVTGAAADDTAVLNAYTLNEAGLNRLAQASRDLKALEARRSPKTESGDESDAGRHDTEDDAENGDDDLASMSARLEADAEVRAILGKHGISAREFATATLVLLRLYLADGFAKSANKPFAQLAKDAGIPAHQSQFFERNRPLMDKLSSAMKGER